MYDAAVRHCMRTGLRVANPHPNPLRLQVSQQVSQQLQASFAQQLRLLQEGHSK